MADGLVVTSLRGMDSTGLFQISENDKSFLHKMAVPSALFLQEKNTAAFLAAISSSVFTVGHCRAATYGRVSRQNAHPFEVPYTRDGETHYLIGVHNGSLSGWQSQQGASKYDVDSEFALSLIAQHGVEAFKGKLPSGAYSFVWWTTEHPHILNFARNEDRPMWLVQSKDKHHIMFASEPDMLGLAIQRNGQASFFEDTAYSTAANCLYSVDVSKAELSVKEVASWEPPKSSTTTYYPSYSANRSTETSLPYMVTQLDKIVADYKELMEAEKTAHELEDDDFQKELAKWVDPKPETSPAYVDYGDYAFPLEFGEIGIVPQDELYLDSLEEGEIEEAEERGLFGQVVVFSSSGFSSPGQIEGSIRCSVPENGYDSDKPADVGATLLWPRLPSPLQPAGTKRFCAIGGIAKKQVNGKEVEHFLLVPLKAGGALLLKKAAEEWRVACCPDVAITMA